MKLALCILMLGLNSVALADASRADQCRQVEGVSDQARFCQQVDNDFGLACVKKIPSQVVNCSLMRAAEGVSCLDYVMQAQTITAQQVQACAIVANKYSLACVKSIANVSSFQINACAYHILDSRSLKCVQKKKNRELADIEACGAGGASAASTAPKDPDQVPK